MSDTTQAAGQMTRRSFLIRAAVGAAAIAGVGVAMQRKVLGRSPTPGAVHIAEDSIFMPRADQRDRVLGRK